MQNGGLRNSGGPAQNKSPDVSSNANGQDRSKVLMSVVNIQEERTLKNVPVYVRDDAALRVRYENPPIFLNLAVLLAAPAPAQIAYPGAPGCPGPIQGAV